jgi:hypothetical protein
MGISEPCDDPYMSACAGVHILFESWSCVEDGQPNTRRSCSIRTLRLRSLLTRQNPRTCLRWRHVQMFRQRCIQVHIILCPDARLVDDVEGRLSENANSATVTATWDDDGAVSEDCTTLSISCMEFPRQPSSSSTFCEGRKGPREMNERAT